MTVAVLSPQRKVAAAGFIGNVLEWYDFAVYGFFAPVIALRFFPSDDPFASLIAAYGAFAVGFLARPFGAMIFGHVGDRYGRQPALVLSILLMAVPTTLIGLLPGHETIGWVASVLIVAMRVLQGLSVGGEYTGSAVFLVEHAPPGRRAAFGSWSVLGCVAGVLLGSAAGALMHAVMPTDQLHDWGWRLPFLIGILVGGVGYLIRRGIPEPAVGPIRRMSVPPVIAVFRDEWRALLQVIGVEAANAVGFYLMFVYVTTYLIKEVKLPATQAFDINTLNMATLLVIIPLAARLSDRYGRRWLLIGTAAAALVLSYPLLWLMHHPNPAWVFMGQFGFAVITGFFGGAIPTVFVELFPRHVRSSAVAIGHNLTYGILGGTAPIVAAYLIEHTRDDLSVAWYLTAAAALSLVTTATLPETARKPLG